MFQRFCNYLAGVLLILTGLATLKAGQASRRDVVIEGPLAYGFGSCAVIGGAWVIIAQRRKS